MHAPRWPNVAARLSAYGAGALARAWVTCVMSDLHTQPRNPGTGLYTPHRSSYWEEPHPFGLEVAQDEGGSAYLYGKK